MVAMIIGASEQADLIIDFAVGYADFITRAVSRGAGLFTLGWGRVAYTDEVLIARSCTSIARR